MTDQQPHASIIVSPRQKFADVEKTHDDPANRVVSRRRVYFLPNDEQALLTAFQRDFPAWQRPEAR